jgi:hypothetical protein
MKGALLSNVLHFQYKIIYDEYKEGNHQHAKLMQIYLKEKLFFKE